MSTTDAPKIALVPAPGPAWLATAIVDGGGHLVALDECEAIIWADASDPDGLVAALAQAPGASWVQLPFAGIENFLPHLDRQYTWTCGKGVYADPVAEIALALALGSPAAGRSRSLAPAAPRMSPQPSHVADSPAGADHWR